MTTDHCPICGEQNKCLVGTVEQSNCWCINAGKFPDELLGCFLQRVEGRSV